jgi:hypothetical protein
MTIMQFAGRVQPARAINEVGDWERRWRVRILPRMRLSSWERRRLACLIPDARNFIRQRRRLARMIGQARLLQAGRRDACAPSQDTPALKCRDLRAQAGNDGALR